MDIAKLNLNVRSKTFSGEYERDKKELKKNE